MKICPQCQNAVNSEYLFCPKCGRNLKNCHHCGKELPDGANFCPYCGKSVVANSASVKEAVHAGTTDTAQAETASSKSPGSNQPNRMLLSKEVHQDILTRFKKMHSNVMGSNRGTKPIWEESATKISLADKWEHWVGHDDTLYESISLSFSKVWTNVENVPWVTESEWPCRGQALIFDKSWPRESEEVWDQHYTFVTHKAWLLKEPYGLPGLWRFEYQSQYRRS